MTRLSKEIDAALSGSSGAGYNAIQSARVRLMQDLSKGEKRNILDQIEPVVRSRQELGWSAEGLTMDSIIQIKRNLRNPPPSRRGHSLRWQK